MKASTHVQLLQHKRYNLKWMVHDVYMGGCWIYPFIMVSNLNLNVQIKRDRTNGTIVWRLTTKISHQVPTQDFIVRNQQMIWVGLVWQKKRVIVGDIMYRLRNFSVYPCVYITVRTCVFHWQEILSNSWLEYNPYSSPNLSLIDW